MTTINESVEYTQNRINTWYENAKIDYDVIGHGTVIASTEDVTIIYTEDGITNSFSMTNESINEEAVDYLFNVWSEQA